MKKRIGIVLLVIALLTGCKHLSIEDKIYRQLVKQLQQQETFDQKFPFDININIERLTKYEITYHLVIDNFDQDINDIQAIVIHDQKTEDVYPSVGIYEDRIDLTKENKKGILLVGYIDYKKDIKNFKGTFKAKITYKKDKKEITKFYSKQY